MTVEAPQITVKRFSKSWSHTNPNSLISEFISISKETNREPDTYHFIVGKNSLIDPNTKRSVLEFIEEGVEKEIARNLESWASNNNEGLALWISPKLEGYYPCPKVIIHRIAYTPDKEKVVLNSVILFDAEIENPVYKRGTLYTLPDTEDNILKIIGWIKRKSKKDVSLESTSKTSHQKAVYFANQVRMGIPHLQVIQEMKNTGFLGVNSISCPTSFSSLVESNSILNVFAGKDKYGSLEFS
ncbi:MAG: hypothetical protein AAB559_02245, partial [Patescibacteria group bacterium]